MGHYIRSIPPTPRRSSWQAQSLASPRSAPGSDSGFEDAVKVGLDRANATLRGVTSAWVKDQSVDVQDGTIVAYSVNSLVTFVLE